MLKTFIDNIADVPGPLQDYYQKTDDGRFALLFDGKDKLKEFRDHNIELQKTLEKFPDAAKVAVAKAADLEQKLAAFDGVDPDEYRVLKARVDTSKRAAELEAELATTKTAHAAALLKNAVSVEFLRQGGRASAVDFMVQAASKTFSMENGELTTNEFSATNPGQPLTVEEWMGQQIQKADFAFQPSRGGGAPARKSAVLGGRSNVKELRNPSPQELGANASAIARGDIKVVGD